MTLLARLLAAREAGAPPPGPPRSILVIGGIAGGRPVDRRDPFEAAVAATWGTRMLDPEHGRDACEMLLGSITNVDWTRADGEIRAYTFAAAGDMVAALLGEGDHRDWTGSGSTGAVEPEFAQEMALAGWTPGRASMDTAFEIAESGAFPA